MASTKNTCLHKTKENKIVTVKGVKYEQKVCKTCGHILRSQQSDEK